MAKITFSGQYASMLSEFVKKHPDTKSEIDRSVDQFAKNPDDTRLNNHKLTRRMKGMWAFSITGDIRIVYKWTSETTTRFLAVGKHQDVYF